MVKVTEKMMIANVELIKTMMRFLTKTLLIHFLVVLLVDGNHPIVSSFIIKSAFAEGNAGQEELQHLYSTYAGLKGRTSGGAIDVNGITEELMSPRGKELLDRTQAFIANPSNRTLMATPEGQELAAMHNRFTRMRKVKSQLDSCFTGQYAELNQAQFTQALPERVFAAAFMTPEGSIPCDPQFFTTSSIDELFGGVSDVVNGAVALERVDTLNKLQKDISQKNLENAVQSMVTLDVTYSGADLSSGSGPLSQSDINEIVNKVCRTTSKNTGNLTNRERINNRDKCSRQQKADLRRVAQEKQAQLVRDRAPTFTHRQAADQLRTSFDTINSKLTGPDYRLHIDRNWRDSVDTNHPQTKKAYENYINDYMGVVRSHPGMLALTDAVSDDLGGRRDQDGRVLGFFGSGGVNWETGTFKPHAVSHLETGSGGRGIATITEAIAESRRKIIAQASSAFTADKQVSDDMSSYVASPNWYDVISNGPSNIVNNREESLSDLIKRNPSSVGQVLMQDPSLASEACRIMRKIAEDGQDDADGSWLRTALLVGGLALGAIALVGVGALLIGGIGLLVGAASGGAAVAWGGTLLTSLALPGLAYGVVESGDAAYRWRQASNERDALLSSYLAGGGDDATVEQFWAAQEEANNAAWELGLALGFTVLDAPAVIGVARLMDGAQGVRYLQDVSRMFNYVEGSRKLRNLFRAIKGSMGIADFRTVMKQITKLDNGLDFIKDIEKLNVDEATALFRQAHTICVRSCS